LNSAARSWPKLEDWTKNFIACKKEIAEIAEMVHEEQYYNVVVVVLY
jgi:hypothetical protein